MRIVCVGAGPAGLYFAICAKLRDPNHQITILERDPPGSTHGWGVVYWEPLLDVLVRGDATSAHELRAASTIWREHLLTVGGPKVAYLPGYGYSIQRATLLDVLSRRAAELGIELRYRVELADAAQLDALKEEADLVVAADGANSRVRRLAGPDAFATSTDLGANQYIWLGTDKFFENFRFAFERTPAGWIWFHAYPSAADISTCIVECAPATWTGLGLDRLDDAESLRLLEGIFSGPLDGHRLISSCRGRPARWQQFVHVTNRFWHRDNVVLIGDAAHTTHFTIGSGTALAIMDAFMLVRFLRRYEDLNTALGEFDRMGHAAIAPPQAGARRSMRWFEQIDDLFDALATSGRPAGGARPPGQEGPYPDPVQVAYAMATRHGNATSMRYRMCQASQIPAFRAVGRQAVESSRWLHGKRRSLTIRSPASARRPPGPHEASLSS